MEDGDTTSKELPRIYRELTTITPEAAEYLCSKVCQSACCDFYKSNHYVGVEMIDYYLLQEYDLSDFVTFSRPQYDVQLLNRPDGKCIFLSPKNSKCTIYPIRPQGCRDYPFVPKERQDEIPDWCVLLHNSTDELRKEMSKGDHNKQTDDIIDIKEDIPSETISEYISHQQQRTDPLEEKFIDHQIVEKENEFWSINFVSTEVDKEDIITLIKNKYITKDWHVISIRVYNEKMEDLCILEGIWRAHNNVEIPYINTIPPEYENYIQLLKISYSNSDMYPNLIAGVYLPDEVYEYLENTNFSKTAAEIRSKKPEMFQE